MPPEVVLPLVNQNFQVLDLHQELIYLVQKESIYPSKLNQLKPLKLQNLQHLHKE